MEEKFTPTEFAMTTVQHKFKSAAALTTGCLLFSVMGALVKTSSQELSTPMLVFFRNFMALLFFIPLFLRSPKNLLETKCLRYHLLRTTTGLIAMYCLFHALAVIPLSTATTLYYTFPLFGPLVARLWIKEPIAKGTGRSLILGFLGVSLLLKPSAVDNMLPILGALLAGILTAVTQVTIRRMALLDNKSTIVFYFCLFASCASAFPLITNWTQPSPLMWSILLTIGGIAALAQYLLAWAYSHASVSFLSPFVYIAIAFSTIFDVIVWHVQLDFITLLGITLSILGGINMMLNQHENK